jgi:hypothetical protein
MVVGLVGAPLASAAPLPTYSGVTWSYDGTNVSATWDGGGAAYVECWGGGPGTSLTSDTSYSPLSSPQGGDFPVDGYLAGRSADCALFPQFGVANQAVSEATFVVGTPGIVTSGNGAFGLFSAAAGGASNPDQGAQLDRILQASEAGLGLLCVVIVVPVLMRTFGGR